MDELALDQHLKNLQSVAEAAIGLYHLPPNATVVLVNLSENATYRVEDPASSQRWALRVHREGYHSKNGITSELAWLMALRNDGSIVCGSIVHHDYLEVSMRLRSHAVQRVVECCLSIISRDNNGDQFLVTSPR